MLNFSHWSFAIYTLSLSHFITSPPWSKLAWERKGYDSDATSGNHCHTTCYTLHNLLHVVWYTNGSFLISLLWRGQLAVRWVTSMHRILWLSCHQNWPNPRCKKVSLPNRYSALYWPMSAHASQAFSIAHCTDSEDLPARIQSSVVASEVRFHVWIYNHCSVHQVDLHSHYYTAQITLYIHMIYNTLRSRTNQRALLCYKE